MEQGSYIFDRTDQKVERIDDKTSCIIEKIKNLKSNKLINEINEKFKIIDQSDIEKTKQIAKDTLERNVEKTHMLNIYDILLNEFYEENIKLKKDIKNLKEENEELKNEKLKDNEKSKEINTKSKKEIKNLKKENKTLEKEINNLKKEIEMLDEENEELKENQLSDEEDFKIIKNDNIISYKNIDKKIPLSRYKPRQ